MSDTIEVRFVPVADIVHAVCAQWGVTPALMMSAKRQRLIARPRQAAMYLAYKHSKLTLPGIGAQFDRDHTTVLHAVRLVPELVARDKQFAASLSNVRTALGVA